jgi:glycosyltransferase involved in cell wall biosynthesis
VNILYVACGIPLPGTLGGSTHAREVARGLAERGHVVHVVAAPAQQSLAPLAIPGVTVHTLAVPKLLSFLGDRQIDRWCGQIAPDVVMERYHNFAGGGLRAAARRGIPTVLEVNAAIIDPPAVLKRRIDDLLGGPLRRAAVAQCCLAGRIVTPLASTVPDAIARERIVELPWGAAVERFTPAGDEPARPAHVVFLGSFRGWHGAADVVRACGRLYDAGMQFGCTLIGDGPERAAVESLAARWPGRFRFSGAVPYERVPALLAEATVGVAPFDTTRHPALRAAGFFWSPLKVYEYMAAGLPVVTTDLPPLNRIIRAGQEGELFAEGDVAALARALERLLRDPSRASALGRAARERVVAHYSWAWHCAELERIMQQLVARG